MRSILSVDITIQGQVISFPSSGQSPNWAPAVISFAQAVEAALASVVGTFDVPPQVYSMVANSNTDIDLPNLAFSVADVRGAFIRYTIFRTTETNTSYESGNLVLIYNPSGSVNNKWEASRDYVGNGSVTFSITDAGQVRFSSTSILGANHSGKITYVAQALLNS